MSSCELFYLIWGLVLNVGFKSQNMPVSVACPRSLQMFRGRAQDWKKGAAEHRQATELSPASFWPCPLTSECSMLVFFQFSRPLLRREAVQIQKQNQTTATKKLQVTPLLKLPQIGKLAVLLIVSGVAQTDLEFSI